MIMLNPDYHAALPTCHQRAAAKNMREAVVLLHRCRRSPAEDADLMRAATASWECAALGGIPSERIGAGLVLAQTQLALGQRQAAVVTAERVQRLARGTPQAIPATLRALMVGAKAWCALGQDDHVDHLLALARIVVETCRDADERGRLFEQIRLARVETMRTSRA